MNILKSGDSKIIKQTLDDLREIKNSVSCLCWEDDKVACANCGCKIQLTLPDDVKDYQDLGHCIDCPGCGEGIRFKCKKKKKNKVKRTATKESIVHWPCIGPETYLRP